jgi:hypothetical protein
MPEPKGTIETIESWEQIPKALAEVGMAELVHDSTKNVKPIFGESQEDSLDYVRVWHVFVGSGDNFRRVRWRFHYDKRPGAKSSLRMTDEGIKAISNSMTVMGVVQKLNMDISGNNGEYDFEKLKDILEEAVKIVKARKKKKTEEGLFTEKEVFDGS